MTHRDTVPAYPRAWRWQNPLPNGNPLASVSFADDANGWTVGGHGTVFKTADGGLTWSAQDSTVPVDLTRVVGSSSTTAWAVGNAGTIVRTRDGGATWTRLESGSTENLTDLAVPTEGVVWVVGENGTILRTDDSGATWRRQTAPAGHTGPASIAAATPSSAWVTGAGDVLKTADGGASWTTQLSSQTSGFFDVAAFSETAAWVAAGSSNKGIVQSLLYRTTDGGTTWSSTDVAYVPQRIFPLSPSVVWVRLWDGRGLATADGGATWRAITLPGVDAALHSATAATVVGEWGDIRQTADGGASWTGRKVGLHAYLLGVAAPDEQTVWVVGSTADSAGAGLVLTSEDAGATWTSRGVGSEDLGNGVTAASRSVGWTSSCSRVWKTADGARTWVQTGPNVEGPTCFRRVAAPSESVAWVAGGATGVVHRTEDGGATWAKQVVDGTSYLEMVAAASPAVAWAASTGAIFGTADGGSSWRLQRTISPGWMSAITAVSPSTAWAVGSSGTVLRTTDGGTTWTDVGRPSLGYLSSAVAVSDAVAWVGGVEGTDAVWFTADGGSTWTLQRLPTNLGTRGLAAGSSGRLWAISRLGGVLSATPQ